MTPAVSNLDPAAGTPEPVVITGMDPEEIARRVNEWAEQNVPLAWREAAARGGAAAIREVRRRAEYEVWYPRFGASGLVAPNWPIACGGLGLTSAEAEWLPKARLPRDAGYSESLWRVGEFHLPLAVVASTPEYEFLGRSLGREGNEVP